jgi:hypothetical protein
MTFFDSWLFELYYYYNMAHLKHNFGIPIDDLTMVELQAFGTMESELQKVRDFKFDKKMKSEEKKNVGRSNNKN